MRRISLLALFLLGSQLAFAQFSKGEKEYIVRFRFQNNQSNTDSYSLKTTNFNIINQLGWFVKENLSVGATASYGLNDYFCDGGKNVERDTHTLGLGIYVRRYFHIKGFSPYIQSKLSYSRSSYREVTQTNTSVETQEMIGNSLGLSANPGLQVRLSDWFSLEGNLNSVLHLSFYDKELENGELTSRSLSFNPNLNLSLSGISIGARFRI